MTDFDFTPGDDAQAYIDQFTMTGSAAREVTVEIPEAVIEQIRKHMRKVTRRSVWGTSREICGHIIVKGTTAVRFHPLANRARKPHTFLLGHTDYEAAHAELAADEWPIMTHTHPSGHSNPSSGDLDGANPRWLGRPYAIFHVAGDRLHVHRIYRDRSGSEELTLDGGSDGNRQLTAFRATLPPEGSELRICPPGCTVDHDAIQREREAASVKAPVKAKAKTPERPTTDREEETMATTADIAQGFSTKESNAYTAILNAKGRTVARAYQRKNGAVLYFAETALSGVSVAKELTVEDAKGGEKKIAVNGGARQLQAARTVLKRAGAAAA